jgi:hypothetical protein
MKTFFLTFLLALLGFLSLAVALQLPQKSFVVSFPPEALDKNIEEVKQTIRDAGGRITHEFTLFK